MIVTSPAACGVYVFVRPMKTITLIAALTFANVANASEMPIGHAATIYAYHIRCSNRELTVKPEALAAAKTIMQENPERFVWWVMAATEYAVRASPKIEVCASLMIGVQRYLEPRFVPPPNALPNFQVPRKQSEDDACCIFDY